MISLFPRLSPCAKKSTKELRSSSYDCCTCHPNSQLAQCGAMSVTETLRRFPSWVPQSSVFVNLLLLCTAFSTGSVSEIQHHCQNIMITYSLSLGTWLRCFDDECSQHLAPIHRLLQAHSRYHGLELGDHLGWRNCGKHLLRQGPRLDWAKTIFILRGYYCYLWRVSPLWATTRHLTHERLT